MKYRCTEKKEKKMYKCKVCTFSSSYKDSLKTHVEKVHQKLSKFIERSTCADCKKSIKTYNIKTHMKNFHSEIKPEKFNCNICTYNTIHKQNLRTHVIRNHQQTS